MTTTRAGAPSWSALERFPPRERRGIETRARLPRERLDASRSGMMDDATVRTPRASSLRRAEIVFGAKTVSRDQNDEHRDRHLGARALARSRSRAATARTTCCTA